MNEVTIHMRKQRNKWKAIKTVTKLTGTGRVRTPVFFRERCDECCAGDELLKC
jgi:hypothetical protein